MAQLAQIYADICSETVQKISRMAKNQKIQKTNAARLLDQGGVPYELVTYTVDESNLAAAHIAEQLGEDIATVFKTIILTGGPGEFFVCVVPGDAEIDLKKAAKVAGYKKVDLIPMKDLLGLTGYIRGGCSPVGMKKPFPTYFHKTATDHDSIYVSAGVRGLQFKLSPADLIKYVGAETADLIKIPEEGQ